jgi:polyisoprenoid-binding protein YceI
MTTTTLPGTQVPTGTWAVDPAHSKLGFAVKSLGVATVRGEFREFEGTIEVGEDLDSSRAYGTVRTASVNTNRDRRDDHLRSADFLDAVNHPELRFESKRIEAIDDETVRIVAELEINGVTREIELEAEAVGTGEGLSGEERLGLEVRGTLSRRDYRMRFSLPLGSGNAFVADTVKLELEIAAVKQG